jgi:hypothetical protein
VNAEPLRGLLSTVISPPIMRARWRLIDRPSPAPLVCRVYGLPSASSWVNGWKSQPSFSFSIPIPVSDTHIAT